MINCLLVWLVGLWFSWGWGGIFGFVLQFFPAHSLHRCNLPDAEFPGIEFAFPDCPQPCSMGLLSLSLLHFPLLLLGILNLRLKELLYTQ